jgi:hypothetical protein
MKDAEERLAQLGRLEPIEAGPVQAIEERGRKRSVHRRRIEVGAAVVSAICLFGAGSLLIGGAGHKNGLLLGSDSGAGYSTTTLPAYPSGCRAAPGGSTNGTSGDTSESQQAVAIVRQATGENPAHAQGNACSIDLELSFGFVECFSGSVDVSGLVAPREGDTSLSGLPVNMLGRLSKRDLVEVTVVLPGPMESVYCVVTVDTTSTSRVATSELVNVAVRLLQSGPLHPS